MRSCFNEKKIDTSFQFSGSFSVVYISVCIIKSNDIEYENIIHRILLLLLFISCSWCPSHTQVESVSIYDVHTQAIYIQWSLYKILCMSVLQIRLCASLKISYFFPKNEYITTAIIRISSYRAFISVSVEITRMGTTSNVSRLFIYNERT